MSLLGLVVTAFSRRKRECCHKLLVSLARIKNSVRVAVASEDRAEGAVRAKGRRIDFGAVRVDIVVGATVSF